MSPQNNPGAREPAFAGPPRAAHPAPPRPPQAAYPPRQSRPVHPPPPPPPPTQPSSPYAPLSPGVGGYRQPPAYAGRKLAGPPTIELPRSFTSEGAPGGSSTPAGSG